MLNIVTALPSEAQAIIEHLSLTPLETHRTPHIYGSDNISLVISGVGQIKSESAVARLAEFNVNRNIATPQAWINVGIAGHRNAELGSCFIIDKIENQQGTTCYPSIPYHTGTPSAGLHTVTKPARNYAPRTLYDMEGYSFFTAAQRHAPLELIVLLKIVSDNEEHPIEQINRNAIRGLIAASLPKLEETLATLKGIINDHCTFSAAPVIDWKRLWHATHAQQQILNTSTQKLALLDNTVDALAIASACKTAEEAIDELNLAIKHSRLRLDAIS